MGSLRRTMPDQHVAIWFPPATNTFQKILYMIQREAVPFGSTLGIYDNRRGALPLEFETLTIDPKSAFCAADFESGAGNSGRECGLECRREFRRVFEQHIDSIRSGASILVSVDPSGGGSGLRNLLARKHVNHINPMGEQIGYLPATEVEICPPVVVLLRIPVAPLYGTEEARPVKARGLLAQGLGGLTKVVTVTVPPGARERDFAELPGVEVFRLGLQVVFRGTL
jgi:hypothetical protein